jgi:hypothetical protein
MSDGSRADAVEVAFGRGLLLGQIITHCEHVLSGGKLAAQIGCQRDSIETAIAAIADEGCSYIIEDGATEGRVAIWIYKHSIAATVIQELSNKTAPSAADIVITGKLFGYSDHEIERYATGQCQVANLTATSGSESKVRCGLGRRGWRKVRGCYACLKSSIFPHAECRYNPVSGAGVFMRQL